jgi:putative molybdopterin biosynthesis protein
MKRYLNLLQLDDAVQLIRRSFPSPQKTIIVPLPDALDRILASPVYARYAVPEVNLSAVDGIAVRSQDTIQASDSNPVAPPVAVLVNTGNVVPPDCDAVIMIEEVWNDSDRFVIRKPAAPLQNIRIAGEDMRDREMILPAGHQIRPFDIGALAAYGITVIEVRELSIGIIPTGGELVPPGTHPRPGHVVESNSLMIEAYLREFGASCIRYPIVPDDPVLIQDAIISAIRKNDLVLVSAGSSAGTKDFTAAAVRQLGQILFHGVAIKPGKPAILGSVEGKPVIGIPGYPLSAQTVLQELVVPLLDEWGFRRIYSYEKIPVTLGQALVSDLMTDEFVYLSVGRIGSAYVGISQPRAAAAQMAAVRSNACLRIPANREGYEEGIIIPVQLTCDRSYIEKALILVGNYDPALDHLARLMREQGFILYPRYTGNIMAIQALRKNICHAAPMVLHDFGECFSSSYLSRQLREAGIVLLGLAAIPLGIVSKRGINLNRLSEVRVINREKGSVPRHAFDELLHKRGIDPGSMGGYSWEVKSHQAVVGAILRGIADAGISSHMVAEAYGLTFTPLTVERYNLVFRKEQLQDKRVLALFDIVSSPRFRDALRTAGGYDLTETGVLRAVNTGTGAVMMADYPDQGTIAMPP